MLLVGNHSGGNMTPRHDGVHGRVQHLLRRRARLLPARAQPGAVVARPELAAQVRHGRGVARERAQGALLGSRAARLSRAATTRSIARAGRATGSTSAAARDSSGSRSSRTYRSSPSSRSAARRRRCSSPAASGSPACSRSTACSASRSCRSRSSLPWIVNVGDFGHIPLPAKITIETLAGDRPARRVRPRARPRRGLRPPDPTDAGRARRARRRAALSGDRMRVTARHRSWRPRSRTSGRSSPTPSACSATCRASPAGRSRAICRTGLGARYRMLFRVGAAEVGGLIEVVEFDAAVRARVDIGHRPRPARAAGACARRPGGRTRVELRLAYGVAGAGLSGWLAERIAAPSVARHVAPAAAAARAPRRARTATGPSRAAAERRARLSRLSNPQITRRRPPARPEAPGRFGRGIRGPRRRCSPALPARRGEIPCGHTSS